MALIAEEGTMANNAVIDALIRHSMGGNGGRGLWFSLGR